MNQNGMVQARQNNQHLAGVLARAGAVRGGGRRGGLRRTHEEGDFGVFNDVTSSPAGLRRMGSSSVFVNGGPVIAAHQFGDGLHREETIQSLYGTVETLRNGAQRIFSGGVNTVGSIHSFARVVEGSPDLEAGDGMEIDDQENQVGNLVGLGIRNISNSLLEYTLSANKNSNFQAGGEILGLPMISVEPRTPGFVRVTSSGPTLTDSPVAPLPKSTLYQAENSPVYFGATQPASLMAVSPTPSEKERIAGSTKRHRSDTLSKDNKGWFEEDDHFEEFSSSVRRG